MSRPLRSRRRRAPVLAAILGLALVLAGCSTPGSVDDFNADVEQNFNEKCIEANGENLDREDAEDLCGCWYEEISTNMSFDEFEAVEERIRTGLDDGSLQDDGDLRDIAGEFYDIVTDSCVEAGPSPSR